MQEPDEYTQRLAELQREAHPEVNDEEDLLLAEIKATRELERRVQHEVTLVQPEE